MITLLNKEVDAVLCDAIESRRHEFNIMHTIFGESNKFTNPVHGEPIQKIERDVLVKMNGTIRPRSSNKFPINQVSGLPSTLILPILQEIWKDFPKENETFEIKWR